MSAPAASQTEAHRRREWLAARRQHITSNDLAAIMNIDGAYSSPMGVYLDKKGLAEESEPAEWMVWGNLLQQPILMGWAEREGRPVEMVDPYTLFLSRSEPILGASLDGLAQDGDGRPVDAKNIGFRDEQWGEDYTHRIPERFIVQLHAQMDVTETQVADLAVLFGGRALSIFRVHRIEEVIVGCREAARDFWERHVLADVEPPVDGSDEWTRFLASRVQKYEDYLDVAKMPADQSAEALKWTHKLRRVKAALKKIEALEQTAANHVRAIIGDHAGLLGPFGRVHFKRNEPSQQLDTDGYLKLLEHLLVGVKPEMFPEIEALRQQHTATIPGNRPLLLPKIKKAKTP